jgi:hypothetical protein
VTIAALPSSRPILSSRLAEAWNLTAASLPFA